MTQPKRVYLAGPEVFFPATEHQIIVTEKKRILRELGWEGVDPLDTDLEFSDAESPQQRGFRIYRANRELMDSCDAVIANLTPFRGISADPGTVFEVGYLIGQGKQAIGYSLNPLTYRHRAGNRTHDDLGHAIEDFNLADNLMIECGIVESGGQLFVAEHRSELEFFDAELFEKCARALDN
ncbi:nucleoside 2-deoxyribosyltransferase [Marinobacter sp. DUT-1]|uniref:nucleoside 2-deoxyribosyltransferase n=1 Tax=Marinobacter sp. DUT-1 TaxID=3412037 RepID=UPI003D175A89